LKVKVGRSQNKPTKTSPKATSHEFNELLFFNPKTEEDKISFELIETALGGGKYR